MQYFLITFGVLIVVIAGMAVGVIFSNKELKGSCGGLGKIMGEDCMFCEKKDECDKHTDDCETDCDKVDECESKTVECSNK
jgi:hypothetical protein